jgi:hypothetical protein
MRRRELPPLIAMTESFPDGSVLVKEVFQAATGPMTTGTVSHAETWFVMT